MTDDITPFQQIKSAMESAKQEYESEVNEIQAHARELVLIPFLEKRGWSFRSGNGTYVFWDRATGLSKDPHPTYDPEVQADTEFQDVVKVLELPTAVYGGSYPHTLGETMEDYDPES